MDYWKYAVIWLLPGATLVGVATQHRAWRKDGWLVFVLWCAAFLALGPFFLAGVAYYNIHR